MSVENVEQDMLEFVRARMKGMTVPQQTQIGLNAGVSYRTVRNILEGKRDVLYSSVKNLRKAVLEAEAQAVHQ